MQKQPVHIHLYKQTARRLGLQVTIVKLGRIATNNILISNGSKCCVLSPTKTGFYPRTTAWFKTVCNSKTLSQEVLKKAGYKTIRSNLFHHTDSKSVVELQAKLAKNEKFPILVKPEEGRDGQGITISNSQNELLKAGTNLFKQQLSFMTQNIESGCEYRILLVNNSVMLMHLKEFPFVLGNGVSTISELLETASDPIDNGFLKNHLKQNKMTLSTITAIGKKIPYHITKKSSLGYYKTNNFPKVTEKWALQLAKKLNTQTVGIDVFIDDFANTDSYRIIEINANPGFMYIKNRYNDNVTPNRIVEKVLRDYFNL